ncbi:MAG: TetR/AcrR family transcriptional regulator [Epsilonproteobacteria bacterium]|nr:MAG: TetR/AcrR family transcriptional regulator [Campylobacterota bacterium]
MPTKQKRDAKKTKQKILTYAMSLFSQKGFNATTVDDIAKAGDVNKALIYYYFKNKADLYANVMSESLQEIYENIDAMQSAEDSPTEALKQFILSYATFADVHPYFPALLLRELSYSGSRLPETMFVDMRRLFALLSAILERGEASGEFHNVIPMIIHFMILGTINLMITTAPLRLKAAAQADVNVDTCAECTVDEISHYVFEKIKLMLKEER